MRLDSDLIRRILLALEEAGETFVDTAGRGMVVARPDVTDDDRALRYHVRLLLDSPYVDSEQITDVEARRVWLSLRGHDLVDMIRDEARWKHARFCVEAATGGCSLELIEQFIAGHVISRTTPPD